MSEIEVVQSTLRRTARRVQVQRAWRGFWRGFLVGAAVWLGALAIFKLAPIPPEVLAATGWLALGCPLVGLIVSGWRRPTLQQTARWLDEEERLQERLSTALEVSRSEPVGRWEALVVADAARHAEGLDPQKSLPWSLPRLARWVALVLALAAGLGFVPEYRSQAHLQKKRQAEVIRESGDRLIELTKRQLETRPPAMEPTRQALESVEALGQQLAKARLTRAQALRELSSVKERLEEQARQLEKDPALRKLRRAARTPTGASGATPEGLQKRIESLQQQLGKQAGNAKGIDRLRQKLDKVRQAAAGLKTADGAEADALQSQLSEAMADLVNAAAELGLDLPQIEEAIQALESGQIDQFLRDLDFAAIDLEKMAQMAQAMKDLQQQLAELGQDLAEQLEKGQAPLAVATLSKMMKQLEGANLSPEQLQKILDEVNQAVAPGNQYGQVGEFLAQAVQSMRQGDRSGASESLGEAAEELKRLMEQMSDGEGLLASLDALKLAQMSVGNCMGWGMCEGYPGFKPGGKPGAGVGTWGDDSQWLDDPSSELWDNSGIQRPDMDPRGLTDRGEGALSEALTPTKVKGKISPGGSMPSIVLKGVSIRGQSTVAYEEAVTTAQTEAQSALSQEQVPRAYQGAVRDYFDDLKE